MGGRDSTCTALRIHPVVFRWRMAAAWPGKLRKPGPSCRLYMEYRAVLYSGIVVRTIVHWGFFSRHPFSININVAYLSLDVFFSITPLITLDCTIPVALYCLSSLLLHFWGAEKIRWMETSPAFPEEGSRAHPSRRHQFFLK
jgi:hypothetical protein